MDYAPGLPEYPSPDPPLDMHRVDAASYVQGPPSAASTEYADYMPRDFHTMSYTPMEFESIKMQQQEKMSAPVADAYSGYLFSQYLPTAPGAGLNLAQHEELLHDLESARW
jgi:hypothetical protein